MRRVATPAENSGDIPGSATSYLRRGLESLNAQTVLIPGSAGDEIEAYLVHPAHARSRAGVVVVHDLLGYDSAAIEGGLRLAWLGYEVVCPNLFWRDAPGAPPHEASDVARLSGGVPDERAIGDLAGGRSYLRSRPTATGRVGIVGFGAGAREAVLAACHMDLDAVVDCYGEFIVGSAPDGMFPFQTASIDDDLSNLRAPLLGLFGGEDGYPSRAHVAELDEILCEEDKPHEFHSYDRAGHAFMSPDHPSYRVAAANDGWERIAAFLAHHLGGEP